MTIYDDMRQVASDVIGEFKQGSIAYVELQPVAGATPDNPGTPVPVTYPVNGVTRPVEFKYVDGTNIVQSDEQFTIAALDGVTPTMEGYATIDGRQAKIVGIKRIPAAGDPITFVVIVRR
jgi:hypothetical protein